MPGRRATRQEHGAPAPRTRHSSPPPARISRADAARDTLDAAGVTKRIRALAADAGYWRAANVDGSITGAPKLFIAVAKHARRGTRRKDGRPSESKTDHLLAAMQRRLDTKPVGA